MKLFLKLALGTLILVALGLVLQPRLGSPDPEALGPENPTRTPEIDLSAPSLSSREALSSHGAADGPASSPAMADLMDRPSPGRNLAQLSKVRSGADAGSGHLARVVMNCVADILHAEGRGTPLEEGASFELRQEYSPDRLPIVRHSWDGAWLLVANRDEFPFLFEIIDLYRSRGVVTEDHLATAFVLAAEADAAYAQINSLSPHPDLGHSEPEKGDQE